MTNPKDDMPLLAPPPLAYGRLLVIAMTAGLVAIAGMSICTGVHWFGLASTLAGASGVVLVLLVAMMRGGAALAAPSSVQFLAILALVAGGVRLAAVLSLPYVPHADFLVYHQSALTLAQTSELHIPAGGSFRAFLPPGQIFAMSLMYRLFDNGVLAVQMLNVLLGTLTVVGIWYLGRSMFNERVGRVAALLAALLPSTVFATMLLGAEVHQTFWLVAALCLYVAGVERRSLLLAALAGGLCLGVGALVRPTFVLLPVALGLHMLIAWPRGQKLRAILATLLLGVGIACAVLPWSYRNYQVLGGWMMISSNGGGNLYSANNCQAQGSYTDAVCRELFAEFPGDDLGYDRAGFARAKAWMKANPGRVAQLSAWRFVLLWWTDKEIAWWATQDFLDSRPDLDIGVGWRRLAAGGSNGYYWALALAGVVGMLRWRRVLSRQRLWMAIPVLTGYFTVLHMLFEAQGKYHYSLVGLFTVFAALAVTMPEKQTARQLGD